MVEPRARCDFSESLGRRRASLSVTDAGSSPHELIHEGKWDHPTPTVLPSPRAFKCISIAPLLALPTALEDVSISRAAPSSAVAALVVRSMALATASRYLLSDDASDSRPPLLLAACLADVIDDSPISPAC